MGVDSAMSCREYERVRAFNPVLAETYVTCPIRDDSPAETVEDTAVGFAAEWFTGTDVDPAESCF